MMLEQLTWPMIFAGGLLGSSHCVGMCGGFAMTVGASATSWRTNLQRQLTYSAGRLCTYGMLGGLSAGLGSRFTRAMPAVEWGQAALAFLAGALLLFEGLKATGYWPGLRSQTAHACSIRTGFAALLRSGQFLPIFVSGFTTGWLPCGLVYAFLAMSAQCESMWNGAATMLIFGAGTVPLMIAVGLAPGMVGLHVRRRMMSIAAWAVVATGLLTIARGVTLAQSIDRGEPAACPFCQSPDQSASGH